MIVVLMNLESIFNLRNTPTCTMIAGISHTGNLFTFVLVKPRVG